ncbi:MAG TPA: hypothetical protein DIV39_09810, partial [Verrucomicrobiales bacterium]|nr:hypothetical protein [Verrucomicrobiales bacterium]
MNLNGPLVREVEHGAHMKLNIRCSRLAWTFLAILITPGGVACANPAKDQLAQLLKRFPQADANKDGVLTVAEALAFRDKASGRGGAQRGAARSFKVHPGWEKEKFPEHAMCYQSPERIRETYAKLLGPDRHPIASFAKPKDGGLRLVGTGHSFMGPGYKTLPKICQAAGFKQPLHLHTGGGMTGSTRYKWEQENGIFQFKGKAKPKLLASIANAEWEAMMWG